MRPSTHQSQGGLFALWGHAMLAASSIVLMILPLAKNGLLDRWIKAYLLLAWLVIGIIMRPAWLKGMRRALYAIPIWLLFLAGYGLIADNSGLNEIVVSIILFFSCAYIYDYYSANPVILSVLCGTALATYLAGAITSVQVLLDNPMASRLVSTGDYEVLALTGVGEYRFAYAVALLLPCLLSVLLYFKSNLLIRALLSLLVVFLAYFLYLASFVISLGIVIAGIPAVVYFSIRNRDARIFLVLFIFVVGVLISSGVLSRAFFFIAQNADNETISSKAVEIATLNSGSTQSDMDIFKRWDLYSNSIETFMKYPLLGVGPLFEYESARRYGIGCHSEWLDTLARLGLIGSIPLLACLISLFRYGSRIWRDTTYGKLLTFMSMLFILFGFFNPLLGIAEIGVVVFLVWPALPLLPWFRADRETMFFSNQRMRYYQPE